MLVRSTHSELVAGDPFFDSVKQLAEMRHQEVVNNLTSLAEDNQRTVVAQLTGEAARVLHEQAVEYSIAQVALTRYATTHSEHVASYFAAKQAASSQQAQAALA